MHAATLAAPTRPQQATGPAAHLPARGGRCFLELAAAFVVATVTSLLLQAGIDGLTIPQPSFVADALVALGVTVAGVVLVAAARRGGGRGRAVLGWVLPAAFTTGVQALRLHGTPFYLNGTGGDQFFRMQYLQRLAASPHLADGNYADLPPYYPAGWFWVGGRFADLTGTPPWMAYKPYAIATIAVTGALVFVVWSLLLRRRAALVLAMTTALAGVTIDPYEPYAWLIMALIPPMAVLAWRLFTAAPRGPGVRTGTATVLLGVFLGVAGAVYTLMFLLFVLVLVLLACAAVLAHYRPEWFGGSRQRDEARRGPVLARAARLSLVGLVALPVVLLVWAPYLWTWLHHPNSTNDAGRFLPQSGATLSAPFLEFSVTGALAALGLAWIVLAWRRSATAQALGLVVLACYCWELLGKFALAAHTTLLSFNAKPPLELALWCAAVFGGVELVSRFAHRSGVKALAAILAVIGLVQLTQYVPDTVQPLRENAQKAADAYDTQHGGQPDAALIDAIARLSGRPPQQNVLLTGDYTLLDFQPYWSFQTTVPQYANPMADYERRNDLIRTWSHAGSPQQLAAELDASPVTPPNVFVLQRQGDGLHMALASDGFPHLHPHWDGVVFDPALFAGPQFRTVQVGSYTVVARR